MFESFKSTHSLFAKNILPFRDILKIRSEGKLLFRTDEEEVHLAKLYLHGGMKCKMNKTDRNQNILSNFSLNSTRKYAMNKLTYIKALEGFETLKIGMHGIMGIFLFVDTDNIKFHEANKNFVCRPQ